MSLLCYRASFQFVIIGLYQVTYASTLPWTVNHFARLMDALTPQINKSCNENSNDENTSDAHSNGDYLSNVSMTTKGCADSLSYYWVSQFSQFARSAGCYMTSIIK